MTADDTNACNNVNQREADEQPVQMATGLPSDALEPNKRPEENMTTVIDGEAVAAPEAINGRRRRARPGRWQKLWLSPAIAFFLAIAGLQIAYLLQHIFPYGKQTLLLIDLYHQYTPFLAELQDRLAHASSLFFSWNGGLGVNFLSTISYYLASPLNLLLVLFPAPYITEAVLVLTLLKVGLAAAFFTIWLRTLTGRDDYPGIAFALMYALSGYVVSYAWNIMWLDGIYLLPLVLAGLVRLMRGGNALLYAVSLALLLLSNFYISFFAILFIILYYPILLNRIDAIRLRQIGPITLRVGFFSLLGLMLSAILVLPTIIALRNTSAANDPFPTTVTQYGDFFDFFIRHLTAAPPSPLQGQPNLYCGVIVLLLVPFYFLSATVKRSVRIGTMLLFLFLVISFNLNLLDFIWHGFHFPNQLPFRNAYVYAFLIVTLAYEAWSSSAGIPARHIGILFSVLLGLVVLAQKLAEPGPGWPDAYLTVFFLFMMCLALTIRPTTAHRAWWREFALFLLIAVEVFTSTVIAVGQINTSLKYAARDNYASGTEVDWIRSAISTVQSRDHGFHRMEIMPSKTVNDPFLYHYQGLSIFSSMSSENTARTMNRLGFHGNDVNSYRYSGSTMLLDAILGMKYLLYRDGDNNKTTWNQIGEFDGMTLLENPDAMSVAFFADAGMTGLNTDNMDPIAAQEAYGKYLTGYDGFFSLVRFQNMGAERSTIKSEDGVRFQIEYPDREQQAIVRLYHAGSEDQYLYLDYQAQPSVIGLGYIVLGDKRIAFDSTRDTVVDIGFVKQGETLQIELWPNSRSNGPYAFSVRAHAMDFATYKQAMSVLRERQLTVERFSDGHVDGRIDARTDGSVFTSIPYDHGWTVRVDGKEVPSFAIDQGFLGFPIQAGSHHVQLRFVPQGFWLGFETSVLAMLFLLAARWKKWHFLIGKKS